LKLYI